MRCMRGAIFDVIIDLRPRSATYLGWQGFELSAENRRAIYIPKGFAHGFQTLTDDAEVAYQISAFYAPEAAAATATMTPPSAIVLAASGRGDQRARPRLAGLQAGEPRSRRVRAARRMPRINAAHRPRYKVLEVEIFSIPI